MSFYNPARFKTDNPREIEALVRAAPLATLVSLEESGKIAISHLPLIEEPRAGRRFLIGHLARANPHWRSLESGEVTAIFHGPDAYASPTWYQKDDVPTWSYAVVHMRGRARLIESFDGIVDCVKRLSTQMEASGTKPWEFWLPPDLADPQVLVKAIVGFEIEVTAVDAKFKLNQTRPRGDQEGNIKGLRARNDQGASQGIANLMQAGLDGSERICR